MPEIKIIRYLDKMAVRRVFDNILSNAARYADGDFAVKLTAEGKILFSNHAANLSRVEVERLFERFFTVQTAKESTGIGLSIGQTFQHITVDGSIIALKRDMFAHAIPIARIRS